MALPDAMTSVLRRTQRLGLAAILVVLAIALNAQQPTVVRPAQPLSAPVVTGSGAITGVVVDATSGRSIAGAMVRLEERRPGLPVRSVAQVATPSGRFAFLDLAASDGYLLAAAKPGYLGGGYRRADPRGPSAPLPLKDGEWIGDIRITMWAPGSIGGTVVDDRGEPVTGAYVRVLPQVTVAGRTQWLAGPVARTDDRGAYRIAGLGPGKYIVSVPSVQATLPASATIRAPGANAGTSSADLRAASEAARAERLLVDAGAGQQLVAGRYAVPPPPAADGRRLAYPIAFYPNVVTPADATPIELGASEDRSGVDFQLLAVRTSRLSGIVQGPADAVSNLLLRLVPLGLEELGQGSEAATTVTLADGRFTFLDVPAGSYVLETRHHMLELTHTSMDDMATAVPAPVAFPAQSASAGGVTASAPGVSFSALSDWAKTSQYGQMRVDAANRDVDDIVLTLRRPASLSGRFEWAPGVKPATGSPWVVLEPADGRRSLGMPQVRGGSIGAAMFTLDGMMPGDYVLRVRGASVASITWDGRDYTDRPFDGTAGEDFKDVVVTLTTATSSIRGVVTDGAATLTSGAAVIAFPVERERWSKYGLNPTRLKSVLTTPEGRYRLDGLPAGEYYLHAVPASQERAWIDPAFLASHAGRAARVRIDRHDMTIADFPLSLVK